MEVPCMSRWGRPWWRDQVEVIVILILIIIILGITAVEGWTLDSVVGLIAAVGATAASVADRKAVSKAADI